MRLIVLLGAIGALSQPATAQIGECKSVADPAARLACYDKAATPPVASAGRPAAPARSQTSAADGGKSIGAPAEEDDAVNARLRGICRGC